MAQPNEPENNDANYKNVTWGTLEDLLLACAVNRYGTNCWDSVTREIQKRSSTLRSLNPLACQQKYHDLRRRLTAGPNPDAVAEAEISGDDITAWLDELRKLRIDELKRELQHYDHSILSLQSKVSQLTDERQQMLVEDDVKQELKEDETSDLNKSQDKEIYKEDDHEPPPANNPDKFPGEESDRENISVNESNSTDPKAGDEGMEKRIEPGGSGREEAVEPDTTAGPVAAEEIAKPIREDSSNGSSDTTMAAADSKVRVDSEKIEPERKRDHSSKFGESVAESKGGGGGEREGGGGDGGGGVGEEEEWTNKANSDVQSSASLSRKKVKSGDRAGGVSSFGEESEDINQCKSKTIKSADSKSGPLAEFLEVMRSRKLFSVFERRRQSLESSSYKNLIRQHIDLENIQSALDQGHYSGCATKFYRDFLLLATNYIVFFGKKSAEYQAAEALRQLVINQVAQNTSKKDPHPSVSARSSLIKPNAKDESQEESAPVADPLLLKPKLNEPVIACKKRSSITAKSTASSAGGERKRDLGMLARSEEKGKSTTDAQRENSSSFGPVTTKRTRDQRNDTRSNSSKSRNRSKNPDSQRRPSPSRGASSGGKNDSSEHSKSDRKGNNNNGDNKSVGGCGKKGASAANFLNRIKRASPSDENKTLSETVKTSGRNAENASSSRGGDPKKNGKNSGGDRGRDQNQRPSNKSKPLQQAKDKERGDAAERKDSGRPPKRAAAMAAMGNKRRRNSLTEVEATPKKRSRK